MTQMERRIHPRAKLLKPVAYKLGATMRMGEAFDAEIMDISSSGTCVICKKPYEPDSLVWLRLPPHPRLSKVRWVGPTDGRFKMGLKFLTRVIVALGFLA
jgi:hypothetical protein